jgi:hypothetical protein
MTLRKRRRASRWQHMGLEGLRQHGHNAQDDPLNPDNDPNRPRAEAIVNI